MPIIDPRKKPNVRPGIGANPATPVGQRPNVLSGIDTGIKTIPVEGDEIAPNPNIDPTQVNTNTGIPDPAFNVGDQFNQAQSQGQFEGGNILSGLDPALQKQIQENILAQASGTAFDSAAAASNLAFDRQAENMRARAGAGGGALGQGGAKAAQQTTEQNILSGIADRNVTQDVAKQNLMQQGTALGLNLAGQNEQSKQFAKNLQLAFTGLAADQSNLMTKLTVDQQNMLTQIDWDKAKTTQNLATQLQALGMQITSTEKMQASADWLKQQGVDLAEAQLKGFMGQDGNWVMGSQQLQTMAFQAQMNSQSGKAFHDYLATNLDAGIDDPAVKQLGQALWESMGNEGEADDNWIKARIQAARDPRLTNLISGTMFQLDQALENGDLTQEQYDKAVDYIVNNLFDPDVEDGPGDGSGTSKENYDTFFYESDRPTGFDVSFEDWKDAGSPNSWEDYITNLTDNVKDIDDLVSDGAVSITRKELEQIGAAYDAGSEEIVDKYGISDDSILAEQLRNPHTIKAKTHEEAKKIFKIIEEEGVGNIITTPEGETILMLSAKGNDDYDSLTMTYVNIKTGETGKIKF